jgi:hypothetical protein
MYIQFYDDIFRFIWYHINVKKYKISVYNNIIYDYITNISSIFNYNIIYLDKLYNIIKLLNEVNENIILEISKEDIIGILNLLYNNPQYFYNELKLFRKHIYSLKIDKKIIFEKYYIKDYYEHKNYLIDNMDNVSDSDFDL